MALLPFVGKIPRAMMNALKTVGFFLFTLAIVFAGFVFGFSTIYSASSTQFSTPTQSMLTLWGSLLGNIDVDEFLVSNYYIGIFLFMWFSFIVLFTCLTFMISGTLRCDSDSTPATLHVLWCLCCDPLCERTMITAGRSCKPSMAA
eukprot:m.1525782 g.1525782  ORF g.1525782 m.1525782 type:complete len:146 (+) comp25234_c0_seq6:2271-2708(+)